jgi:hypothetical protein
LERLFSYEVKKMTLLELISTLKTSNITVTVVAAETDSEIIVFKASGIAGVESDLSGSNVRRWEITGASAIKVVVEESNP